MKDKSKMVLIGVILVIAATIAYVCYGITKGNKNPVVTMEVSYRDSDGNEKNGTVKIELYPNVAPESVANFIALANNGFYDGLTFHRIEKDFVVQGGDKNGDGSGSAKVSDLFQTFEVTKIENKKATLTSKKNLIIKEKEVDQSSIPKETNVGDILWFKDGKYQKDITDYTYSIKGEFSANGVNNNLKFAKGVIGMARSDYSSYGLREEGYNSASSQFFFVTTDKKTAIDSLNQNYAPFGKVIEGYEYIEEIAKVYAEKNESSEEKATSETTENAQAEANQEAASTEASQENAEGATEEKAEEKDVPKMKSVRVETYGANYGLPKMLNYDETLKTVQQYQSYYQQLMNQSTSTDNSEVSAE
ncbi:MAG: peptidylprolyl isomerase [Clostridia bacterium]|nr:peptidylprolyl isomerase [Clostridia bacterium]